MKKIFNVIIFLMLMLVLTGCSSDKQTELTPDKVLEQSPTTTVATINESIPEEEEESEIVSKNEEKTTTTTIQKVDKKETTTMTTKTSKTVASTTKKNTTTTTKKSATTKKTTSKKTTVKKTTKKTETSSNEPRCKNYELKKGAILYKDFGEDGVYVMSQEFYKEYDKAMTLLEDKILYTALDEFDAWMSKTYNKHVPRNTRGGEAYAYCSDGYIRGFALTVVAEVDYEVASSRIGASGYVLPNGTIKWTYHNLNMTMPGDRCGERILNEDGVYECELSIQKRLNS